MSYLHWPELHAQREIVDLTESVMAYNIMQLVIPTLYVWCRDPSVRTMGVGIHLQVSIPKIICKDKQDVGRFCCCCQSSEKQ
jgi:hypothetical protein